MKIKQITQDKILPAKNTTQKTVQISWTELKELYLQEALRIYPNYDIKEIENTINLVCMYFAKSVEFNNSLAGRDYRKGLFLMGKSGRGKTMIFRIMQQVMSKLGKPFGMVETWRLVGLHLDTAGTFYNKLAELDYCFDEIGLIEKERFLNFGSQIDIGTDLVMHRDLHFTNNRAISHFTSNLNLEEIKALYGSRVYSRLYQMCNFISVEGKDLRATSAWSDEQESENVVNHAEEKAKSDKLAIDAIAEQIETCKQAGKWVQWGFNDGLCSVYWKYIYPEMIDHIVKKDNCKAEKAAEKMSEVINMQLYKSIMAILASAINFTDDIDRHRFEWNEFKKLALLLREQKDVQFSPQNFFYKIAVSGAQKEITKRFIETKLKS